MEKEPKRLKIAVALSNGSLDIEISDTGKGIEKEKIKSYF